MSHQSSLIAENIDAYLKQHENKELLRLLTCGSVDDGKSTLIGRLLHDSKMIYEDHLAAIASDTKKHGTTGDTLDLALLVDGLQAEREQGITIDVAYRYFSTEKRKFIIADTPGHEQYTRNMATGASTCNLAIILIDARHGVLTQTRRHSYITSLLGVNHIVVAINKMDLVNFDQSVYEKIKADFLQFAETLSINDAHFLPISALQGDNVVDKSSNTPWYSGPSLMELLETVEIGEDTNFSDFRFPVQFVNRPNLNFRGFCGTITSGVVKQNDTIKVLPSGKISTVKDIVSYEGSLPQAFAGQSITLTLNDEIDISRGDVIVQADDEATVSNCCKAHLIWMNDNALNTNRGYLFKFAGKLVPGRVVNIDYQIDVNTQEHHATDTLALNSIAVVDVLLNQPIVLEPYLSRRGTGSFIVIDRLTNLTVGAGMLIETLPIQEASAVAGEMSIEHELSSLLTNNLAPSEFEQQLNKIIRKHYPHWQSIEITNK